MKKLIKPAQAPQAIEKGRATKGFFFPPEFIQKTTIEIIKAYLDDIEGINHLHKSSAYALLKMCINQRPNFLRRCSPRNETMDSIFNGFDQRIDDAISKILGRTHMDAFYVIEIGFDYFNRCLLYIFWGANRGSEYNHTVHKDRYLVWHIFS